jgi:hypothetical protein
VDSNNQSRLSGPRRRGAADPASGRAKEEHMRANCFRAALAALAVTLGLALLAPGGAFAVGVGKTCGGIAGVPCDDGLFCQFKPRTCNIIDNQGKCVKVPQVCTQQFRPVCGCDGKTYGNDCERRMAKAQLNHRGQCKKY